MDNEWRYRTTDQRHRHTAVLTSHMLVSLLSLFGEGFEGSLVVFPLAEAAVSALAATAVTERLVCSSPRASGLGCVGGACSAGGWTFSSCCSLWLCNRRSWTRSSKMASCSSWMAWFRWVFLFYRATKSKQALCNILLRPVILTKTTDRGVAMSLTVELYTHVRPSKKSGIWSSCLTTCVTYITGKHIDRACPICKTAALEFQKN